MILIGLILAAAASAVAVDLWLENPHLMMTVQAFGHTWSQPMWVLLVTGVAVGFGGLVGLLMMGGGMRRSRRIRVERRAAMRDRELLARQPVAEPAPAPAAQPVVTGPAVGTMSEAEGAPATPARRRGLFSRSGRHVARN